MTSALTEWCGQARACFAEIWDLIDEPQHQTNSLVRCPWNMRHCFPVVASQRRPKKGEEKERPGEPGPSF